MFDFYSLNKINVQNFDASEWTEWFNSEAIYKPRSLVYIRCLNTRLRFVFINLTWTSSTVSVCFFYINTVYIYRLFTYLARSILNYINNRHFIWCAELRCSFTDTSIAGKILLKQFSLTILYIKHRNVVTLDRNFKRTQDEIARKNLRQNYRLLLFAFTSLNERSFILVYGTKLNRDVNTYETLQKAVSIQHEINCLLTQNPRIQNK